MGFIQYAASTLFIVLSSSPVQAQSTFTVVGWNVESGKVVGEGADPDTISSIIGEFRDVDIWGLSEVFSSNWAREFEAGAEKGEPGDFRRVLGTTGDRDRLLILYDHTQFEKLEDFEIGWEERPWFKGKVVPRSPLAVKLRHRKTSQVFYFMVNHLYRGKGVDPRRLDQAKLLGDWAAEQEFPVIAVGDYNFGWDLDPEEANDNEKKGFGDLTASGAFKWVKPKKLVKTFDSAHNSVLDFVFLADPEGLFTAWSTIIVRSGDFPDDESTPDHRPVLAKFEIRSGGLQE